MKDFKITYYIAFFITSMLMLASCINDDLSQCTTEKRVFFDYTSATKDAIKNGINPNDLVRMNLYVFDENGKFVREFIDEQPALSPNYYMDVTGLAPGHYQFVAWGNLGNQYALSPMKLEVGVSKLEDLQVELTKMKNNKVVNEWLDPLFFATHKELKTIEILQFVPQDIHLQLIENTYRINVEVIGLDSITTTENTFRIEILDSNGKYKFDNDFAPCEEFSYTSIFTVRPDKDYRLEASLMVLRLLESRQIPIIRIVNDKTNVELVRENLIELILAAQKQGALVDFSNTIEFNIRFEFNPNAPLECNIYVNGYKVIDQGNIILV